MPIPTRPLPLEALAKALVVDPSIPQGLRWIVDASQRVRAGMPAGNSDPTRGGYWRVSLKRRLSLNHRVVWAFTRGRDPGDLVVDHIDRDPSNNHPDNLRLVTSRGNNHNREDQSPFGIGVQQILLKKGPKYKAAITLDGHVRYLGFFDAPEEAAAAYQQALIESTHA